LSPGFHPGHGASVYRVCMQHDVGCLGLYSFLEQAAAGTI
jgi:hypothetical protein